MELHFKFERPTYKGGLHTETKAFDAEQVYKLKPGTLEQARKAARGNGGDEIFFKADGDTYVASGRRFDGVRGMERSYRNYHTLYRVREEYASNARKLLDKDDRLFVSDGQQFIAAKGTRSYNDIADRMSEPSPLKATLNGKPVDVVATDDEVSGAGEGFKRGFGAAAGGGALGPFIGALVTGPAASVYGLVKSALPFSPDALAPFGRRVGDDRSL